MTKLSTSGVQPFIFSEPSPYILLESVHDILKYLNHDIIMQGEHGFLNRTDISLDGNEGLDLEKKQFLANGLLVTGLLEVLTNDQYDEVECQFDTMIGTLANIIQRKLEFYKLVACHSVFIHKDDYGDIVIGFVKKNDRWKEYNDETGYLKLCS